MTNRLATIAISLCIACTWAAPAGAATMTPAQQAPSTAASRWHDEYRPAEPWNIAPTYGDSIDVAGPFHFGYSDPNDLVGVVYVQFYDNPPHCNHPLEDGSMYPGLYSTDELWSGKESDYFFYFDPIGGYFDTPLEPDSEYCYTIQSVNAFGESSGIDGPYEFTTESSYTFDDDNQLFRFDDSGYDVDFRGGDDEGTFGGGDDDVRGGTGDDTLESGGGNDVLIGGPGDDVLDGGPGNDELTAGAGRNRLRGGSGNDRINAANGRRDRVNCGAGRDRVVADARDVVAGNCEAVSRRHRR